MHFSYLSAADVVRHSLVSRIVDAYAKFDEKQLVNKANEKAKHNSGGKR
jgi:phosphate starvation-inducible PhoH-like protein